MSFSPDGQRLVTASENQTARIWNLRTNGGVRHMLRLEQAVTGLQFSPDGRRVLTTSNDGAAQLWDAQTGELVGPAMKHAGDVIQAVSGAPVMQTPPQSGDVTHAEFSPDRRFLLTLISAGSDSPAARVWECATGEPVTPLLKHTANFSACAWNPNGREVAIAAYDGAVLLLDVSPAEGPVEALRREAELLSAHRILPGHGLIPLTAKEMRERWEALKAPPSR